MAQAREASRPSTTPAATLAIVFAMEAEWAPWRARHAFRRLAPPSDSAVAASIATPSAAVPSRSGQRGIPRPAADRPRDIPIYEARIGAIDVRVIVCGIGPARAAAAAAIALSSPAGPVDGLLVCGFAGGLRPALHATEVTVARRVHTQMREALVSCDERLIDLAARAGATVVDSLLTVDRPVFTVAEKVLLGRDHDVVEMEGFPLLAEAAGRGIPGAAVRVVSDDVHQELPPELRRAMRPDGSIAGGRLFRELIRRPWRWPAMWRLVGLHGKARTQLVDLLDRLVAAYEPPAGSPTPPAPSPSASRASST